MSLTERLYWIDGQIKAQRFPNAASVSAHFEVSRRTAYKDRDHLLNRLQAPLVYDRSRDGWTYADPNYMLPFLALSEREAAALRRSLLAAQEYLSAADTDIVGQLFVRLSPYLASPTASESLGGSVHLTAYAQVSSELLDVCRKAAHNRQRLRLYYYSAHRDATEWRIIHPYHLHTFQGEPHLLGWCEWRQEVRQFFLGRIREYELLAGDAAFTRRDDFDAEAYLRQGLALQHSKEAITVRARFSAYQARWIRERQYHPSQQIELLPEGGLILTLQVTGTDEARRWLLAYGGEVEALEPEELRNEIVAELKKLQNIYGLPSE